jgi:hypothetical protein
MCEEEIKELIKKATVKINIDVNGQKESGTGILITQNNEIHILTVYHCIFGKEQSRLNTKKEHIHLTFHETFAKTKFVILEIKSIDNEFAIISLECSSDFSLNFKCINTVPYEKDYHIIGFPSILEGALQPFRATCNDNNINTIGFNMSIKDLTSDTSGDNTSSYISGLSGSGVFFSEFNQLYLVGLVNSLGTKAGSFNRVDCIKLIDLENTIELSLYSSINSLSDKIKKLNTKTSIEACEEYKEKNIGLYNNLNRKHLSIFNKREVDEKNLKSIKKFTQAKSIISELELLSENFEDDLLCFIGETLDLVQDSVSSRYIDTKQEGRENLRVISEKTLESIKEKLVIIKDDSYLSNQIKEYIISKWLLSCDIDFILEEE